MRSWSGAGTSLTPCCTSRPTPGIAGSGPFGCSGSIRACPACSSACSGARGRARRHRGGGGRAGARRRAGPPAQARAALAVRSHRPLLRCRGRLTAGGCGARYGARPRPQRPGARAGNPAHVSLNVLGWIGLTIVGTLVTLWPTMLRTRIAAGSERAARRALPILVLAIGTTSGGALAGRQLLAALGLIGYLAGLAVVARPFVTTARSKPPASYPTWSVAAGLGWLLGCLSVLAVGVGTASSWAVVGDRLDQIAPLLTPIFAQGC